MGYILFLIELYFLWKKEKRFKYEYFSQTDLFVQIKFKIDYQHHIFFSLNSCFWNVSNCRRHSSSDWVERGQKRRTLVAPLRLSRQHVQSGDALHGRRVRAQVRTHARLLALLLVDAQPRHVSAQVERHGRLDQRCTRDHRAARSLRHCASQIGSEAWLIQKICYKITI